MLSRINHILVIPLLDFLGNSSLAIWSSFSQELPPGSRMLPIKIHSSYKYKDITITKTIMVRHNGQFCSNSVKRLLTNCWKLAGLGANNRSAKNKNFFILVWHETHKVFYELEKGNWMFSKQTTLHGTDFLETHDRLILRKSCGKHVNDEVLINH